MASQFDMDVEVAETPTHKRSRRYEDEKMDVDAEEHVRVVPLVYPNNCTWDAASGVLRSIPGEERRSLAVNPEALEFLRSLNPSRKLGTISICGPARTGKSLVAGECVAPGVVPCPFALGHTMNACTYGIWIGLRAVSSSSSPGEEMDILVMDVEGTGFHQSDAHADYQLMVCALLLSSTLVYNSKGVFDKDSIDKIQFLADLSTKISCSGGDEDGLNFKLFFPAFTWLLRDCHLDPSVDPETRTVREYFDKHVLRQNQNAGFSQQAMRRENLCQMFLSMFPEYDADALPIPHSDQGILQQIGTIGLDPSLLNPAFIEEMNRFVMKLLANARPKRIIASFGTGLNQSTDFVTCSGPSFADWTEAVVEQVNSGVPNIENIGQSVMRQIFEKAARDGLAEYETSLSLFTEARGGGLPLLESQILEIHKEVVDSVMRGVGRELEAVHSNPDITALQTEIKDRSLEEVTRILGNKIRENAHSIRTYCEDWLHSNYESINEMMNEPSRHDMNAVIDAMKRFQDGYFSLHVRGAKQFDDAWSKQEKIMQSDRGRFRLLRNYDKQTSELRERQRQLDADNKSQAAKISEIKHRNAQLQEQMNRQIERHEIQLQEHQKQYNEMVEKQTTMIQNLEAANQKRLAEFQRRNEEEMRRREEANRKERERMMAQMQELANRPPQGGGCFSSSNMVRRDNTAVSLAEIRVGDCLGENDEVYFNGHCVHDGEYEFVKFETTEFKKWVSATKDHFLPVCISGKKTFVRFGDLMDGNFGGNAVYVNVWADSVGKWMMDPIDMLSVKVVKEKGLYNPFTMTGELVVNEVLVSCHSKWILDDVVPDRWVEWLPIIYQALFAVFRVLYKFFPGGGVELEKMYPTGLADVGLVDLLVGVAKAMWRVLDHYQLLNWPFVLVSALYTLLLGCFQFNHE